MYYLPKTNVSIRNITQNSCCNYKVNKTNNLLQIDTVSAKNVVYDPTSKEIGEDDSVN